MNKILNKEQLKQEAELRMCLDRYLTELGWPAKARDYALAEVINTPVAQSYLFGGQPKPDADELASAVFATEQGAIIKGLVDEASGNADFDDRREFRDRADQPDQKSCGAHRRGSRCRFGITLGLRPQED